jgi:hypothetical protein
VDSSLLTYEGWAPFVEAGPASEADRRPFNLTRRIVVRSIDTLTIRRSSSSATFLLHQRDPGRVAVCGGMFHVMPAGVFQPSSVSPRACSHDFDLWRNMQREFSEELLGNLEHDGTASAAFVARVRGGYRRDRYVSVLVADGRPPAGHSSRRPIAADISVATRPARPHVPDTNRPDGGRSGTADGQSAACSLPLNCRSI